MSHSYKKSVLDKLPGTTCERWGITGVWWKVSGPNGRDICFSHSPKQAWWKASKIVDLRDLRPYLIPPAVEPVVSPEEAVSDE